MPRIDLVHFHEPDGTCFSNRSEVLCEVLPDQVAFRSLCPYVYNLLLLREALQSISFIQ